MKFALALFILIGLHSSSFAVTTCEALFDVSRATPLEKVLDSHMMSKYPGFDRLHAESLRGGRQILEIVRPFLNAAHRSYTGEVKTARDYLELVLRLHDSMVLDLAAAADEPLMSTSGLGRHIKQHLSAFEISDKVRKLVVEYISQHGEEKLRDVSGNSDFERLAMPIFSSTYGALGEILVSALVSPTSGSNRKIRSWIDSQQIYRAGLDKNMTDREIDLVELSSDNILSWSEVKFGRSAVTLESYVGQNIIKQAAGLREILARLKSIHRIFRHRIYLIYPFVDTALVNALSDLGAEVIVVDLTRDFKSVLTQSVPGDFSPGNVSNVGH